MHFEILVEGQADLTALSILMPKILCEYGHPHTWKIHKHRGIGNIPKDPKLPPNKNNQTLLHNLPSKLRAYGNANKENIVVIVLVDLDDKDYSVFKHELENILHHCNKKPNTLFCIAIEELEAWFLGDITAIKKAYPWAKDSILELYKQDSQCGTWEILAEAVYPGGLNALGQYGKRSIIILEQKRIWAKDICPHLNISINKSPSFHLFYNEIHKFLSLNNTLLDV